MVTGIVAGFMQFLLALSVENISKEEACFHLMYPVQSEIKVFL